MPTLTSCRSWLTDCEIYKSLGEYVYNGEEEETIVLEYEGTEELKDVTIQITSKAMPENEYGGFFTIKNVSIVPDNNSTGIETIRQTKTDVPEGIYTLQGIKVKSFGKGLKIVRMADGTVRKMMF